MCPIDYVWYVGERFRGQENSPGDGNMLVAMCWYCTFFLPLLFLINVSGMPWAVRAAASMVIIFIPFAFCRVRYDAGRREAMELRYGNKRNWGRRLLVIWGVLVVTVVMELAVLVGTGFWHIGA